MRPHVVFCNCRLPKLHKLEVVATEGSGSDPSTMSLVLDLARLQLTALKELRLVLKNSWAGSSYVWQVGRAAAASTAVALSERGELVGMRAHARMLQQRVHLPAGQAADML